MGLIWLLCLFGNIAKLRCLFFDLVFAEALAKR